MAASPPDQGLPHSSTPPDAAPATLRLQIEGMDCADCALALEKGVASLPGVESAQVNFAAATLQVSGAVAPELVAARVQALGYAVANERSAGEAAEGGSSAPSAPQHGWRALLRFFLSRRETALALIAALLLGLAFPLEWLGVGWAAAALDLLIVLLAGLPIARRGLRALWLARQVTIDLLMGIATLGALGIGEFGEAATVVVLFAIGEALEGFTAERARDSLRALLALKPERATVLRACQDCAEHIGQIDPARQQPYLGGDCPFCDRHELTLGVAQVAVGETLLVKPGERIPLDGQVARGISGVNQAPITGESVPVLKAPGEAVFAGSINGEAALEVLVTRPAEDSTLSRIVRLVEQAQAQRAPVERFVDRFAAWYTPAVVGTAALLAIVPPLFFGQPFFDTPSTHGWLYRALALLIVACPCALVISTPVTIVSALTGLARRGVLVKGGQYLAGLAAIKTFAFDKTGTLTQGRPIVQQAQTLTCPPYSHRCAACDELLALAAAIERRSAHPLAQAIVAAAEERSLTHLYAAAEGVEALAGKGVRGFLDGCDVLVGSHALLHEGAAAGSEQCAALHEAVEAVEAQGQTVVLVRKCDQVLGLIAVADAPRPDSSRALAALKALDPALRTVMLTGDNLAVARKIAAALGMVDEVRAGLLPEDKAAAVRSLQAEYGPLAMVGDGVNDAPALASAQVGIAMGGAGSAQAMETADVVLMQDNLAHLPEAVRASRRAHHIIQQNIAFSLALKALFLVLTLSGYGTLWMAVFADMGASLLVTANGMRARKI